MSFDRQFDDFNVQVSDEKSSIKINVIKLLVKSSKTLYDTCDN